MCSDSNSKRLYRRTAEWALETFWINVTNSSSLFIRGGGDIFIRIESKNMRRAHRAVTLKYFSSSLRVRLFSSSSSESSSSSTSGKFADVCVAIGSNLDVREGEDADSSSRFQHFHVALRLLQERGFEIKKLASVYETKPVDTLIENQPKFLNSACVLRHPREWSVLECLGKMKDIEREMGRDVYNTDKGPRVIDLDILFSEKEPMVRYDPPPFPSSSSSSLTSYEKKFWLEVPHGRIKERALV